MNAALKPLEDHHREHNKNIPWTQREVVHRNVIRAREFAAQSPEVQAKYRKLASEKLKDRSVARSRNSLSKSLTYLPGSRSGTLIDTVFPVQTGIVKRITEEVGAMTVIMTAVKRPNGKVAMVVYVTLVSSNSYRRLTNSDWQWRIRCSHHQEGFLDGGRVRRWGQGAL